MWVNVVKVQNTRWSQMPGIWVGFKHLPAAGVPLPLSPVLMHGFKINVFSSKVIVLYCKKSQATKIKLLNTNKR